MTFKPSKYQEAVYSAIEKTSNNLIVEAVAGSGKTTTIITALARLAESGKAPNNILFVAFNKSIATELQAKVPSGVRAKTFNSVGAGALWKHLGKAELDVNKTFYIINWVGYQFPATRHALGAHAGKIAKLVGLAKQAGVGVLQEANTKNMERIAEHHDIEFDDVQVDNTDRFAKPLRKPLEGLTFEAFTADPKNPYDIALSVLRLSVQAATKCALLDFDDQLYLPVLWNLRLYLQDLVFVDEAQDVNAIQRALLKKLLGRRGRLIAVGDSRQAIYGFRGADVDALDLIEMEFNCKRLPLSICYRCDKEIVYLAQDYVPHIEPFEGSDNGVVSNFNSTPYTEALGRGLYDIHEGDAVLCRNTGPLVTLAFFLMQQGKRVNIRGKEIGEGLIKLVEKIGGGQIEEFVERAQEYRDREVTKFVEADKLDQADRLADQLDAILAISDAPGIDSVEFLVEWLDQMFNDNGYQKVQLATCHKAKGLEWTKVFILDFNLIPSPFAKKDWQHRQEDNLAYVAITRAKKHLVFIESPQGEK